MIGYQYTITNKLGDSFKINDHVTDPLNFIALQEYPDVAVDVKNNEVELDGQHGVWDFFSYFGKRTISFSGLIIGEDEEAVEELRQQIIRTLALPAQPDSEEDGYVTIAWTDATGADWSLEAKIDRSPRFGRNLREHYKLDFMLSFKSADPFITGSTDEVEEGERGFNTFGVQFPIELPAVLGEIAIGKIEVENEGTVYAHTKIRLSGEAGGTVTNPTITNLTTGKSFTVNVELADETEYVEIDSKEGTVVDQTGADLSDDIDPDSEFVLLKPGVNELMYTADEGARDPAGVVVVTYRSTRI